MRYNFTGTGFTVLVFLGSLANKRFKIFKRPETVSAFRRAEFFYKIHSHVQILLKNRELTDTSHRIKKEKKKTQPNFPPKKPLSSKARNERDG